MREKKVEDLLREEVKKLGGICVKLSPIGYVGIPDRLIIAPGHLFFVETKKPKNAVTSKMQCYWHDRLRAMGHRVEVCYTLEQVKGIVATLR